MAAYSDTTKLNLTQFSLHSRGTRKKILNESVSILKTYNFIVALSTYCFFPKNL